MRPTPSDAVDAYNEHGTLRKAAAALGISPSSAHALLKQAEREGNVPEALATKREQRALGTQRRVAKQSRALLSPPDPRTSLQKNPAVQVEDKVESGTRVLTGKGVRSVAQLLRESNVNQEEWIVVKKVINKWDSVTKEGVQPLWQVKAWLERRPDWFVTPVKPVRALKRRRSVNAGPDQICLIIPDSQHGYRRLDSGKLEPLHDRAACDLAVQAAQEIQPAVIVLLGDMLDLAPWSLKYPVEASLRDTTQPALVELHWWIASLRTASPKAQIVYLEGNHENRITRALVEKMQEAVNLRPADELDSSSMLSMQRLLSLDKLDVEYHGPYGAAWWLWDKVKIHHGNVVRQGGGKTVSAMLGNASYSQVVGHIHRREYAARAIEYAGGQKVISAMSPGCLCRVDGAVPHNAGSSILDWQQGLGLVYKFGEQLSMQVVPIDKGRMVLHGKTYTGVDHADLLRTETGLPF
jgi:hypothetical protein